MLKLGPFSQIVKPGPNGGVGWGAIGFSIQLGSRRIVNLGDMLLHETEWQKIFKPDVLMLPIGGSEIHNTMDEEEALTAVGIMKPEIVIPCHYNCPAIFTKSYNPADDQHFKKEVEELGPRCVILGKGAFLDL